MNNISKTYDVKRIRKGDLSITGNTTSELWNCAYSLKGFDSPWADFKINNLTFKALWDGEKLFFCFLVNDSNVYVDNTDDSNSSINNSDRVELFFRCNKNLDPYYCLEIDSTSRIMDFKAYPNKLFDFDWNWPIDDIEIKSKINNKGFIVEGALSIESLRKLKLIKGSKIEVGIFRAKYIKNKDLIFEPIWITWINPNTETPNFHIASSFGILNLIE